MNTCPECGSTYPPHVRLCPRDGAVLEGSTGHDPRIGQTLGGKYRIESVLGRGGMGAVYRSTHVMLGKTVAVKLINPELTSDIEVIKRFRREARAVSTLNHAAIVGVHDLGQTDDGTLYLAMEFVEGPSLRDVISETGALDAERIRNILRQLTSALAAAHAKQIIHRDLKPANVVLCRDEFDREIAKLLDFGIAKTFEPTQTQLTISGFVPGTPNYMSPEQAEGEPVDVRSDFYSLGVLLYEMLTGELPFKASTPTGVRLLHVQRAPDPPSLRRADLDIDPALERITLKCLEKDPAMRFQAAQEIVTALDRPIAIPPPPQPAATAPGIETTLLRPAARQEMPTLRRGSGADVETPAEPPTLPPPPVTPKRSAEPPAGPRAGVSRQAYWRRAARLKVLGPLAVVVAALVWLAISGYPGPSRDLNAPSAVPQPTAPSVQTTPAVRATPRPVQNTPLPLEAKPPLQTTPKPKPPDRTAFDAALGSVPGPGRAVRLREAFDALKQKGGATSEDVARFKRAITEQRLVRIELRELARDPDVGNSTGQSHVSMKDFTGQRLSPIETNANFISVGAPPANNRMVFAVATGTPLSYTVVLNTTILNSSVKIFECSGTITIPPGSDDLTVPLDLLLHQRRQGRAAIGDLRMNCQLGEATPLRPAAPAPAAAPAGRDTSAAPTATPTTVGSGALGEINGRAVDADKRPLPGVAVLIHAVSTGPSGERIKDQTVVTDAAGSFAVRGLLTNSHNKYSITGSLSGFRTFQRFETLDPGQTTTIELLMPAVAGKAVTNERGQFTITIEPGIYDVRFQLTGFKVLEYREVQVSRTSGARLDSTLILVYPTEIVVGGSPKSARGRTIEGVVKDPTGAPIEGVMVWATVARK